MSPFRGKGNGIPVRRTSGHARRPRPIRRASPRLSPVRAGAALVALLSALAIYGVGASTAFTFQRLTIEDTNGTPLLTDDASISTRLGLEPGSANLFLLGTDRLAAALRDLPAVTDAAVTVALPDTVRVRLTERTPILVWQVGGQRFLIDQDGNVFMALAEGETRPGLDKLLVVDDSRADSAALAVGATIDPIDFDAATRLGELSPQKIGSGANGLGLSVDDKNGFVMTAQPFGWQAVFGFYTPTLRPPDLIPAQVDVLSGLLQGREKTLARIILASDRSGTYTTK